MCSSLHSSQKDYVYDVVGEKYCLKQLSKIFIHSYIWYIFIYTKVYWYHEHYNSINILQFVPLCAPKILSENDLLFVIFLLPQHLWWRSIESRQKTFH